MYEQKKIRIGDDTFELNVGAKDSVLIERYFAKRTSRDLEIENLGIPLKPMWLRFIVKMLRLYQRKISPKLGNRCVFDPSCSHYAEAAFRERGFLRGLKLTFERLKRCKPENGGIDELK